MNFEGIKGYSNNLKMGKMKLSKLIKPLLGLFLLIVIMSGCTKDDLTATGTLKVTFANHPSDLSVIISPAENSQITISDWLKPDSNGILTYNLNNGNYILISSSSTFFPNVGFQIRAGETTLINFDSNNAGHVQ